MSDALDLSKVLAAILRDPALGPAALHAAAHYACDRAAQRAGFKNAKAYRQAMHLHRKWERAVRFDEKANAYEVDPQSLAECVRRLGIYLEDLFHVVPSPWRGWRPGSAAVVFFGTRPAQLSDPGAAPEDPPRLDRQSNSRHDTVAVSELERLLHGTLGLACHVEHVVVDERTELDFDETLKQHKQAGALILIGSSRINPLADVFAAKLFAKVRGLEVKFQFSPPVDPRSFLCAACSPLDEEGISVKVPGHEAVFRTRDQDAAVIAFLDGLRGTRQSEGQLLRKIFEDCAILYVNCTRAVPIIIAAGHSGSGTVAAVRALSELYAVSSALEARDALGQNRALFLISVRRRKLSPRLIDDFEVADWDFVELPGTVKPRSVALAVDE